jgi:hypothetical protein
LNIFKNIKSFSIKTKLPTQVDSVSALKTSLPSTLEIQFIGESKTEEVKVEWNLEINENLIADISVTGKLSIGRSIVHNVNILDKRIIYFFDCAAESFGAGQYYTLLKNALGKKLENAKADQKYIKGTQAGYSSTLGGDNDNVDITIKNGGGNDIWSHGYWAHGGRSIDYSFDLSEGTYHVNEGFYEWWNTQRNMVISVTANGAQIAGGTFTLGRADTRNQQSVKFTLSSRQTVTVSVKKASGPDPVLSWISILKDN